MPQAKAKMVGRRYGSLVVIGEGLPRFYGKQRRRSVVVRCDCGEVYESEASHIRHGRTSRCYACGHREGGKKTSVRLADGATIAEIARLSGLRLDTVYHRHIRGWPRHRLGEVTQPRGSR